MGRVSIWQEVERVIAEGLAPTINLTPEMEVQCPRLPRGRPMNPPEKRDYRHYAGKKFFGKAPYCRARGCRKRLRVHQPLACSPECLEAVIDQAQEILNGLNEEQLIERFQMNLGDTHRIEKRSPEPPKKHKIPRYRRCR